MGTVVPAARPHPSSRAEQLPRGANGFQKRKKINMVSSHPVYQCINKSGALLHLLEKWVKIIRSGKKKE